MPSDEKNEGIFQSFSEIWEGGYFEGDCLKPLSRSTYGQAGFVSVLHATYLRCIKPYINANTVALEIGPGRGAWTKAMLNAKEIHVMDALPAEHNEFYKYVGKTEKITYHHVSDFKCAELPENYFDYMFSFGCLCHIPPNLIKEYATSLYSKLKSGCNCFWMIADYDKANSVIDRLEEYSIYRNILPRILKYAPLNSVLNLISSRQKPQRLLPDADLDPKPMRWFDAGLDNTTQMLKDIGYTVLDKDVETCLRDPIIHFKKP